MKIAWVPFLHTEQREVNLDTLSQNGMRSRMVPNFFRSKSPSNPTMYTFLPAWTISMTMVWRSEKNCPSLMRMTSIVSN